jgi:hypothetical protein
MAAYAYHLTPWPSDSSRSTPFLIVLEPSRLFRRDIISNPSFISRAMSLAAVSSRQERGAGI